MLEEIKSYKKNSKENMRKELQELQEYFKQLKMEYEIKYPEIHEFQQLKGAFLTDDENL